MKALKKRDSCKPHFQELKLLTVTSLYIYETAMFVKRSPHLFPTISDGQLKKSRRHGHKLKAPVAKTTLKGNSIFCMAPKILNKLPKAIKDANIHVFRKKLTSLLTTKAYYTLTEFLTDAF
jgi:hypothetical protein